MLKHMKYYLFRKFNHSKVHQPFLWEKRLGLSWVFFWVCAKKRFSLSFSKLRNGKKVSRSVELLDKNDTLVQSAENTRPVTQPKAPPNSERMWRGRADNQKRRDSTNLPVRSGGYDWVWREGDPNPAIIIHWTKDLGTRIKKVQVKVTILIHLWRINSWTDDQGSTPLPIRIPVHACTYTCGTRFLCISYTVPVHTRTFGSKNILNGHKKGEAAPARGRRRLKN